jgi:hypothetical protein
MPSQDGGRPPPPIDCLIGFLDVLATCLLADGADRNTHLAGITRTGNREGQLYAAPDPAYAYPLSTQDRAVAPHAKRSLTFRE